MQAAKAELSIKSSAGYRRMRDATLYDRPEPSDPTEYESWKVAVAYANLKERAAQAGII